MKNLIFVLLILSFSQVSLFAKKDGLHPKLRNELLDHSWKGAKEFLKTAKKNNIDICDTIDKTIKAYGKLEFTVVRILAIAERTNCKSRKDLVKRYIEHKDNQITRYAIMLAASLPPKDRKVFKKKVEQIKKSNRSVELNATSMEFLKK